MLGSVRPVRAKAKCKYRVIQLAEYGTRMRTCEAAARPRGTDSPRSATSGPPSCLRGCGAARGFAFGSGCISGNASLAEASPAGNLAADAAFAFAPFSATGAADAAALPLLGCAAAAEAVALRSVARPARLLAALSSAAAAPAAVRSFWRRLLRLRLRLRRLRLLLRSRGERPRRLALRRGLLRALFRALLSSLQSRHQSLRRRDSITYL